MCIRDSINALGSCEALLFDNADQTSLARSVEESALLLNATSVGMAPNTESTILPEDVYKRQVESIKPFS